MKPVLDPNRFYKCPNCKGYFRPGKSGLDIGPPLYDDDEQPFYEIRCPGCQITTFFEEWQQWVITVGKGSKEMVNDENNDTNPSALYECPHCGELRPISEFKEQGDLDYLSCPNCNRVIATGELLPYTEPYRFTANVIIGFDLRTQSINPEEVAAKAKEFITGKLKQLLEDRDVNKYGLIGLTQETEDRSVPIPIVTVSGQEIGKGKG